MNKLVCIIFIFFSITGKSAIAGMQKNIKQLIVFNDSTIFSKVDKKAKYKGNLNRFFNQNFSEEVAFELFKEARKRNKPGSIWRIAGTLETITGICVIDEKGGISDIELHQIYTPSDTLVYKESFRLLELSAPWQPALINKQPVKSHAKFKIKFGVSFTKFYKASPKE